MSHERDALCLKLGAYTAIGAEEIELLEKLQGQRTQVPAGRELIYEGQRDHSAYVLREGWVYSCKRLPDGARQVINVQIAGDFIGLGSRLLRTADQSCVALTDIEVSKISIERLLTVIRARPRLAQALLWAASRDAAIVCEHLVCIGRRDALARTAHFLLELDARLMLIGRATLEEYDCPLSQGIIADTLGVTAIHLNRVLRQLREANLLVFREGRVSFLNRPRLVELIGYDPAYLDHETAPPT